MAAKTLATMYGNVGNMLHDTTSDMATLIKVWLNDAYQDAWRRGFWADLIDENFTFESVVDQADYPFNDEGEDGDMGISDFGKELFVVDIANGHPLDRYTIKDWWKKRGKDYSADSLDSGNPVRYVILPESGMLRLDPPADTAETYAMPYQKTVSDMTEDTDTPGITTISTYLEFYALSMGFVYKKEPDMVEYFSNKAEEELKRIIHEEYSKINQVYQRKLPGRTVNQTGYLLGDKSYDTV